MSEHMSPGELVFAATVGIDYEPQGGIERVVLTPQLAMRPWNIMRRYSDVLLICYPISDEGLVDSPHTGSIQLARLYKALGDEKRLHILKLLCRSEASLDELAKVLGLAKSLVLYHLGVLRSAGLVRTGSDYGGTYRIRSEMISKAGPALRQFLRDA